MTTIGRNRIAAAVPGTRTVRRPLGASLNRDAWVTALSTTLREIPQPVVLVAHSAGVLTTVRWAKHPTRKIRAALLVTPPDFENSPAENPRIRQLGTTHG
ncbi:alpha/beta hydrolase [Nocardia sp. NPDC101769]|uniref:alpha/beta hydrolase n=1 Tax=Nocardia sp. NPDC101769 TaxID=3364333 RepID=UPI0037FE7C4F